jgi:hypothetical protein
VFLGTQRAAIELGPNATGWEYFSGIVVDQNYFDNFNNAGGSDADALLAISLVGQASVNTTVTNNFIRLGPKNAGNGAAIEVTGTGLTENNVIWVGALPASRIRMDGPCAITFNIRWPPNGTPTLRTRRPERSTAAASSTIRWSGQRLQILAGLHASLGKERKTPPTSPLGEVGEPRRIRALRFELRLTWSDGHAVALSLIVVLIALLRITPCEPRDCIGRATVQRATSWPSRFSYCQTLRTP